MTIILPYIAIGMMCFYLGIHYYRWIKAKEDRKGFQDLIRTTEAKYAGKNKKDNMTADDWRQVYQLIKEHRSSKES